jgi:hypothetical protein
MMSINLYWNDFQNDMLSNGTHRKLLSRHLGFLMIFICELKDIPLFVTDGLKFYRIALLKQYGRLQDFARTGKRGRPRLSRRIPDELLKYAQIIKQRAGCVSKRVEKKAIFGEDIDPKMISTSYIERQNLTCR